MFKSWKTKTSLIRVGFTLVNPASWYTCWFTNLSIVFASFTLKTTNLFEVGRSKSNNLNFKNKIWNQDCWYYQQAYQYAILTWVNPTIAWGLILQIISGLRLTFFFIYFNLCMILWSKNIVNCIWCWSLEPVEECGKYMSGHLSHSSLFSDHIPEKHGAAQP